MRIVLILALIGFLACAPWIGRRLLPMLVVAQQDDPPPSRPRPGIALPPGLRASITRTRRRTLALLGRVRRQAISKIRARAAQDDAPTQPIPVIRPQPRAAGSPRAVPAPPPYRGSQPPRAAGPGTGAGAPLAGHIVPPAWQAVCELVGSWEPENMDAHFDWHAGNAAGLAALAEAMRTYAEIQVSTVGIDPLAAQATLDMSDFVGEAAHGVMAGYQKFLTVYDELLTMVGNGTVLPYRAREFFGQAEPGGQTAA